MKRIVIATLLALGTLAQAETITLPQPLVITSAVTQVELTEVTPPLTSNDSWRIRCSVVVPLPAWSNVDSNGVQLRTTASSELVIYISREEIESALGEPYAGITLGQVTAKITQAALMKWSAVILGAAE